MTIATLTRWSLKAIDYIARHITTIQTGISFRPIFHAFLKIHFSSTYNFTYK